MTEQMLQETITTTTGRNFIGGASPDQHKQLISDGWYHDKFANRYRKIARIENNYIDGVLQQPEDEAAAQKVA
jgi:hypothetical protein